MTHTSPLIAGEPIPAQPDLTRMRRHRYRRLEQGLESSGLAGLVLTGTSAVSYATGAETPAVDPSHAALCRPVAVVVAGDPAPHLFTPWPEGAPAELPGDHLYPAVYPEMDDGVAGLTALLADLLPSGARLGCDELSHALNRQLGSYELAGATQVLGPAKLLKTPDELACIRAAQRINELAMSDVYRVLRPGVRQTDLSAVMLRRVFELGATANGIDPVWQVMPTTLASGPWTTHGGVAFPTPTTDAFVRQGDVIWVDSGISWHGYMSDFGRTWIVGAPALSPTPRQQSYHQRWLDVVAAVLDRCKPGVSGLELARVATAANDGVRPWIEHFYLAHGVGTDSAEMPMIGTDLGEAFDERLVLQPGMVLVLEPVIWDDGAAGYRAEDIVAVTDDGWVPLSSHPYDPFEGAW